MAKIGDIIHYVMPSGPTVGEHRPGIVVQAWPDESVNATVFVDSADGYPRNVPAIQVQRVKRSDTQDLGTWHPAEAPEAVILPPPADVTTVITKAEELLAYAKSLKAAKIAKEPMVEEPMVEERT